MSRMICVAATVATFAMVAHANAQVPYPQIANGYYSAAPAQTSGCADWQGYMSTQSSAYPTTYQDNQGCNQAPAASYGAIDYSAYGQCNQAPAYAPSYTTYSAPSTGYWIASGGALFLTREPQDSYTFSFDSANEADQYVDAADADMDFAPGVEASIGHYDRCSNVGWQLNYWQLMPQSQSTQQLGAALAPGFLDGIRNYDQLDYNGNTADTYVNAAQIHRLTRDWEIYNVEANRVIMFQQANSCGSPWRFQSLMGFRFFKFKESLLFVADPSETIIDGDVDEYNINIRTDNQLYGFQLGGITERCIGSRWTVRLLTKAGIYNNHASLNYFEGGSAGAATINNGPNAGQMMRVNTSENDLAFLGELGVGATCRVGCRWRLGADYRVIGATGLALPTDQIYFDTRGINDVRVIDNDGSLLLHGAFVRAERCF